MHLAHEKLVYEIENFIIGRFSKYIETASMGWRYALTVDSHFLNKFDNQIYNPKNNYADVITNTKDDFQLEKPQLSETEIISNILKQSDILLQLNFLEDSILDHLKENHILIGNI